MAPHLIHYNTLDEYRTHFIRVYCASGINTFDNIQVSFRHSDFEHAFFESANRYARDKSVFSWKRAQRIDWISNALSDIAAELYIGWDRDKKQNAPTRRVAVVCGDYVVIISIFIRNGTRNGRFITAYVADVPTITKIRNQPRWK